MSRLTEEVERELEKAYKMFPKWPTDPLHALAILGEEYGELVQAVLQEVYEPHKNTPGAIRKEAMQTAAMALCFLQQLDTYEYKQCKQANKHE